MIIRKQFCDGCGAEIERPFTTTIRVGDLAEPIQLGEGCTKKLNERYAPAGEQNTSAAVRALLAQLLGRV